jgi:hypothetical protein
MGSKNESIKKSPEYCQAKVTYMPLGEFTNTSIKCVSCPLAIDILGGSKKMGMEIASVVFTYCPQGRFIPVSNT